MGTFTVVYDANVLYPSLLRDLLIRLARPGLFRARWSTEIIDELIRTLTRERPDIPTDKLTRLVDCLNRSVADCLVTGHESLVHALELPDPDDRHVLAAAIRCHAQAIVTCNLKDFPAEALSPFAVEAQHPDTFLAHLFDLAEHDVLRAVRELRGALDNPPLSPRELLSAFERHQLARTVARLEAMADLL